MNRKGEAGAAIGAAAAGPNSAEQDRAYGRQREEWEAAVRDASAAHLERVLKARRGGGFPVARVRRPEVVA